LDTFGEPADAYPTCSWGIGQTGQRMRNALPVDTRDDDLPFADAPAIQLQAQ